jgi:uncharacterized spore protein YtfJ
MDVETVLAKASEGVSAGRSFGPVIERDGCLLVPVTIVVGGGGVGSGESPGQEGSGSGGGFGTISWPMGVYVVKDGNARWVPAVDATRLILGGLALVRGIVRARNRRRS